MSFLDYSFQHPVFEMLLKYPDENVQKGVGKMGLDSLRSKNKVGDRCL